MRKWTYLVATLLIAGTTATFTGCIDTDEPEGIVNLRGAKSELIKAQAAVELVEVELKKAQVAEQELVNAGLALQNKSAEIDLQLHQLDVEIKKLEVEREQAATDLKKAEIAAAIAKAEAEQTKWENEKLLIVEQYKEKMLLAETATAKAQDAYKQAMEQIEASKLLLTDQEQARLNGIKGQVAYAKQAMDLAMYGYSTTVIKIKRIGGSSTTVTTPPEEGDEVGTTTTTTVVNPTGIYYIITEDPTQSEGGYQPGSLKKLQEDLVNYAELVAVKNIAAILDHEVIKAEFNLESAQKAADLLKAILDNEYTTVADWEAEVKKLQDDIDALTVKVQQYNIERKKLSVANPELKTDLKDATDALDKAKEAQKDKKDKATVAAAYSKKADASIVGGLDAAVGATSVAGYTKGGTFAYAKGEDITAAQGKLDAWNNLIDVATKGIDLEDLEWSKITLEKAKTAQKDAETKYLADYKAWEEALAAYDKIGAIDLVKSKKAATDAIAAYNKLAIRTEANVDALATALAAYYKDALAKGSEITTATAIKGTDTKAISTWLIASADNFKKIVGLDTNLDFITWEGGDVTAANKISDVNITKLMTLEVDGDVPFEVWKKASNIVFGDKFNVDGNPRRLAVSEVEVITKVNGNKLDPSLMTAYGSIGVKIYSTAEVARLQGVIDQAATYKALKATFTAQKATEQAAQDKANQALADAVTKTQETKDKAQAAYDKIFKEVDDNIEKAKLESKNMNKIKGKIEKEIAKYLDSIYGGAKSLEGIKEAVKKEYLEALKTVLDEKAALATAKRNVEKLAAGEYTDDNYITESMTSIQEKIKVKTAEYDAAKAEYDAASAKLKEILAIFLK